LREKCERERECVQESGEKCREQERKWRAAMAAALLPLQQLQVQQRELGVE
jgi:hypothetical protein